MLPTRFVTFLAFLTLAGTAFGTEFRTERMSTGEDDVRAIRTADLDGDGRTDIAAFADGEEGIAVHVFLASPDGTYSPEADLVVRPASLGMQEVYFLLLASFDPDAPKSIVAVDRQRGIMALRIARRPDEAPTVEKPTRIADAPPLPFYPETGRAVVLDAAADLDRDGSDELLLPCAERGEPEGAGYRIVRPSGGEDRPGEVPTGRVHTLTVGAHRFFTLSWEFPRLTVADWDGDEIPDLIAGSRGEFLLHLQRKDGSFLRVASPLDVLRTGREEIERNTLTLGDVDGDGRTDLLLTQSPASVRIFETFSSQQSLFLNPRILSLQRPGRLVTPAASFKTKGISVNPTLIDWDGDGDLDLLVTSLGLDTRSRIKKQFMADYMLFRFDESKGAFEKDPFFSERRPFPLEQLERNSTAAVCFFSGDFDADGKKDLLDIADDGHISIHKGTTDTGFLSSDRYTFKPQILRARAQVEGDVIIEDLNGDGADDMTAYGGRHVYLIRSVR